MPANVQTMMYEKTEKPWHGMGVAVDGLQTAEQAIIKAGLDWNVEKVGLKDVNDNPVPNHFSIRREDNQLSLGVVGNGYTILQNKDAFRMVDSIIQEKAAVYETAGALGQGEKVWMLAKIDGVMEARKNDSLLKYLLLANTHDGSGRLITCLTTVRVVCQNTLAIAVSEADKIFKIKHTKNMVNKIVDAREQLGIINTFFKNFEENLPKLVSTKMTTSGFKDYAKKVGFDSEPKNSESKNTRAKNQVDELVKLFGEGKGNIGESVWDGLNAITEYVDWNRSTRVTKSSKFQTETEARLDSQWFGSGLAIKEKALEVAVGLVA